MKSLFFFYVLLLSPCFLSAQSFTLTVTPETQSISIGQTATYSIDIKALDGFNSTVFLTVSSASFSGATVFSSKISNFPYANISLQITPSYHDTGYKSFTITGKNGSVESIVSCFLNVPANARWAKVNAPQQVGFNFYRRTLGSGHSGDVCFINGDKQAVYINNYTNKQWVTDTIVTFLDFTLAPVPFVYDVTNTLWFITPNGIAQFDGKFTTIFNKLNSSLIGDAIGYVELGTNRYPLCLSSIATEPNSFAIEQFDGTGWNSQIVKRQKISGIGWGGGFCIDSSKQIWLSTSISIIRIHDSIQETMHQFAETPNYQCIRKIICDKDGWVWCLYHYPADYPGVIYGNSISCYDGTSWRHLPPLKADARDFLVDENKNVWIASYQGLHMFDGTSWITYNNSNSPLPPPNNNTGEASIIQDKNKNIWMMIQRQSVEFFVYNPDGLVNISVVLSVNEKPVEQSDGISLSPNPVSSVISVSGLEGVSSLRIMNSLGMEVKRMLVDGGKSDVDVSDLVNGMYFVQFRTQTGMVSKSVVVTH